MWAHFSPELEMENWPRRHVFVMDRESFSIKFYQFTREGKKFKKLVCPFQNYTVFKIKFKFKFRIKKLPIGFKVLFKYRTQLPR